MRPSLDMVQTALDKAILDGKLDYYLAITEQSPSYRYNNNDPVILVDNYSHYEQVFLRLTRDRSKFYAYQKEKSLEINLGYLPYHSKAELIKQRNEQLKQAQTKPENKVETTTKPKAKKTVKNTAKTAKSE